MPLCANISISDRHAGNNDFADDDCNDGLPHSEPSRYQSCALLPVAQAYLIDRPEGNICPSGPQSSTGW